MKITVQNVATEYPKIKFPLPEPLAADKFEKLKTTFLPNYDKSEVIAKMVDTFVQKLNEAIAKAEPVKKPESKPKAPKAEPKPQNLTQLKSFLKKGMKLYFFHRFTKNSLSKVLGEERTVNKVQSKSLSMITPKGTESWLDFPQSKLMKFSEKSFRIEEEWVIMEYFYENPSKEDFEKWESSAVRVPKSKSDGEVPQERELQKTKKEKKAAKPKIKKPEPEAKSHFEEDERLIRRFQVAVGKERSQKSILGIYRDMERRITEKKVTGKSAHAGLIKEIQTRLQRVLYFMAEKNLTHIKLEPSENSKEFFREVEKVANAFKIRASVGLLKRFIGIEGEISPAKEKVKNLYAAFERAFKQNKLTDSDIYSEEIKEAMQAMKSYLDGNTNRIKVSPTSLNGLSKLAGLGKPKAATKTKKGRGRGRANNAATNQQLNGIFPAPAPVFQQHEPVITNRYQVDISPAAPVMAKITAPEPERKPDLSGLFTPITAQVEDSGHEKIELPGDLGKFLGYVERYEYSILLRGEKGAGKTRMMYQMMNTFAKAGFKVGCFSLEIGKQSNIVTDMRNAYISPVIANNVFIADSAPNGLDDIRNAAKQFDVICVDSWGKIPGVKADDFDKLRKEFPKTMFIIIFQSTTNGTARGGSMPEYDAGIVIQVANGGRAYCEKNRYSGDNLTYLVFQRKLESQPEPVQ